MADGTLHLALGRSAAYRLLVASSLHNQHDDAKYSKGLRFFENTANAEVFGVNVSDSSGSGPNRYGQLRVWEGAKTTGWCRPATRSFDPSAGIGSQDISTYEVEESSGETREIKVRTFTGVIGSRTVDSFPASSLPSITGPSANRLLSMGVPVLDRLVERSPWYRASKSLEGGRGAPEHAVESFNVAVSGLVVSGSQSGSSQVKGTLTGKVYRTEYGVEYEVSVLLPERDSGKIFRMLPKDFQGTVLNEHFVETESCLLRIGRGGHMVSEFPNDKGRKGRAYHSLEEWLEDNKGTGTVDEEPLDALRDGSSSYVPAPVRGITLLSDERAKGAELTQRGNGPSGVLTGGYFWLGKHRIVEMVCSDNGSLKGKLLALDMSDFTGRVTHRSGRGWVDYSNGVVGQAQGDLASVAEDTTQEELNF